MECLGALLHHRLKTGNRLALSVLTWEGTCLVSSQGEAEFPFPAISRIGNVPRDLRGLCPSASRQNMADSGELPSGVEKRDVTVTTAPVFSREISVSEFCCHCCYDILINPTTLNCGHSFCRHCLALWWTSSKKNECPECRQNWEGFPSVNILLR